MPRYFYTLLLFFLYKNVFATGSDSVVTKHTNYFINIGFHHGMVLAHAEKVKFAANDYVLGINFEILRKRLDKLDEHYNYKGFLTGFGLNYFYIDNPILKSNSNVYFTIESNLLSKQRLSLAVKVCAGLNFVSNPYDSLINPINWVYSSYVNAYLAAGLVGNFLLKSGDKLGLKLMLNHFSNGGIKDPNLGLNFPTAAFVYSKNLQANHAKTVKLLNRLNKNDAKLNVKLSAFATYKTSTLSFEKFHLVNGASLSLNKPFGKNKIHSLAFTSDWIIDRANAEHLKEGVNKGKSHHRFGLSVGHEFLFHKFTWGQHIGYYVFNEIPFISSFYHRHSISYQLYKKWGIGLSLLASEQKANFTDLRLIFRL